jgi:hypothetical protein
VQMARPPGNRRLALCLPLTEREPLIAGGLVASTIARSPEAVNEAVSIPVENSGDNSPRLLTSCDCLWTTSPILGTARGRTKFDQGRDQPVRCDQLVDREKNPAGMQAATGFPGGVNRLSANRLPDSFGVSAAPTLGDRLRPDPTLPWRPCPVGRNRVCTAPRGGRRHQPAHQGTPGDRRTAHRGAESGRWRGKRRDSRAARKARRPRRRTLRAPEFLETNEVEDRSIKRPIPKDAHRGNCSAWS